jgi:hypothetical protein
MTVAAKPFSSTAPWPRRECALCCRCPCAASPACLVLLRAPETELRVHLKASRTAVRDAPAKADTLIPRQFRICSSCTASRLEGGLKRAHFTETPTGFLLLKNGLEQRNAKRVLHVLEVRCKGPHLRPVVLHEAPSRPSVRGFLLNAKKPGPPFRGGGEII